MKGIANPVIADPEHHTVMNAQGAVRSIQAAYVDMPLEELDVIWTPEFAAKGWLVPLEGEFALDTSNAARMATRYGFIIDATDSPAAKFLINDTCVAAGRPFVYAGVLALAGQSMTVIPGRTACLRCLFQEPPGEAEAASCREAGIIGPVAGAIGEIEAAEAIRWGREWQIHVDDSSYDLVRASRWRSRVDVVSADGPVGTVRRAAGPRKGRGGGGTRPAQRLRRRFGPVNFPGPQKPPQGHHRHAVAQEVNIEFDSVRALRQRQLERRHGVFRRVARSAAMTDNNDCSIIRIRDRVKGRAGHQRQ